MFQSIIHTTLLLFTLSSSVNSEFKFSHNAFVAENNLILPVDEDTVSGITEEQFNTIINKISALYSEEVSSLGARLVIAGNWKASKVFANSERLKDVWKINVLGGLARHSAMTVDGFSLIVCHELGHHIGGAPLKEKTWASNEGQSDYFAVTKCLRKLFQNDDNTSIISDMNVPEFLTQECNKAWSSNSTEAALCIRTAMAGKSTVPIFAKKKAYKIKFETPSKYKTRKTFDEHPMHQCRLDTYFQGSLCNVSQDDDFDNNDEVIGACHAKTGHTTGLRPRCWFRPKS